jgi:hypothetical protein
MDENKAYLHIGWGVVLVVMGVAVIFHVPQEMAKIAQLKDMDTMPIFLRFCFYLLGALLIGGGIKKIVKNYRDIMTK